MPSCSRREMYLLPECVSLCLPSKCLEEQCQGHLRGVQGCLASRKLPQYFFGGLRLTATICTVPSEVNGGVKGTYIEVVASLARYDLRIIHRENFQFASGQSTSKVNFHTKSPHSSFARGE